MTRTVALLLVLLASGPVAAQAQARVLFVSDAGADYGIVNVLRADGYAVVDATSDFANGNATLRGDLRGYELVVWSANGNGYGDMHTDASVFANLLAYVQAGGFVFVTGYDSVASPADPLLIEFLGATGSTDVPGPPGPATTTPTSLTTGLFGVAGYTPVPSSNDRDTLTGLYDGTIEVVGTAGGGGAQWTLRRVGEGEIAYVSNGDAGATSSPGWEIAANGSDGMYNAALRNFAFAAAGTRTGPAVGSPRRARVMWLIERPSPAVLVGPDRAWIPPFVERPLALCAGPTCHAVREVRACSPPECPGEGALVVADERVADVSDFPQDRDGWNREVAALRVDEELVALRGAFGVHPAPPPEPARPVRFLRPRSDWVGWELHAMGGIGARLDAGLGVPMVSATLGIRIQPEMEDGLDVMYGTIMGLDLRATYTPAIDGQSAEDFAILVGLSPAFSYAFPGEAVRIPPAWAWFIPELGVAASSTHAATWYVGWHLDAALLVDEHAGFDVRADLVLLDEWREGDAVEAILSLGVGGFFR